MIDKKENQIDEICITHCLNNMKVLISSKKKEEIEKISFKLLKAKEYLFKSKTEENIVRSAIIGYILENFSAKDNKVKEILNNFINCFDQKNIIELSKAVTNNSFKESSPFKVMIEFKENISKDAQYLELYFKIMMISKNIKDIIEGIKFLFNIKNPIIENQLNKLSLDNPYSILLLRDFINELIIHQKKLSEEIILKNVIANLKNYYPFYCPKCLGILYISSFEKIEIMCAKDKFFSIPKDINELKNDLNLKINCKNCNNKIEIYENNYKCLNCDKFFCNNCAYDHKKKDVKNILINIYECGYICEEHCELYSSFCGLCKLNLCKICKENHVHKIDQEIYNIKEELIEKNLKKNLSQISALKEYILVRLSFIYKHMKDFSFNNLFIRLSIWFQEKIKRKDIVNSSKFYFNAFFNEDFKKYYSNLIKYVSEGRSEYYHLLLLIKESYKQSKINIDASYIDFEKNYFEKKFERYIDINNLISRVKEVFNWMELNDIIITQLNKNIKLNNKSKKLKTEIGLLKIKIMALLKSNNLYESNLMKLLNRYLADFLIRKIFEKYPKAFFPIKINFNNFYEIKKNFEDIMIKNKCCEDFLNDSRNKLNLGDSFKRLNEKEKKEKIELLMQNITDENKIIFINPLKIQNETFSVEEMNFVLDTLFYFKDPGNIIAHMNIYPNKSIKLKKIKDDIPNIEILLNSIENINVNNSNSINTNNETEINSNIIIINHQNDKDNSPYENNIVKKIINNIKSDDIEDWLEIKTEIIKDIIKIISNSKDEILKDFYDSSINENININDIISLIFKNDYSNIYKNDKAFTRSLSLFIEDVFKTEELNIDFSKFDLIKDNIYRTYNQIKVIEKLENSFKKLKLPEKIYSQTKIYIKEYIKSLYPKNTGKKLIILKDSFSHVIGDLIEKDISFSNFDKYEKKALILSLIATEIKSIEFQNLNFFIHDFKESIKNYFIFKNVKTIIFNLHKYLESNIKTNLDDNNDNTDLIQKIKQFIKKKKNPYYSDINMNYEKLVYIMQKIFGNDEIKWTQQKYSEVSLGSLLFYYQNLNS